MATKTKVSPERVGKNSEIWTVIAPKVRRIAAQMSSSAGLGDEWHDVIAEAKHGFLRQHNPERYPTIEEATAFARLKIRAAIRLLCRQRGIWRPKGAEEWQPRTELVGAFGIEDDDPTTIAMQFMMNFAAVQGAKDATEKEEARERISYATRFLAPEYKNAIRDYEDGEAGSLAEAAEMYGVRPDAF